MQRLGNRCKVFLSNASDINQRDGGIVSEPFGCSDGGIRAYAQTLLFADGAVQWDDQGAIRALTEAERTAIEGRIAERETCLLSTEHVDNIAIDYTEDYERSDFTCVGPDAFRMLLEKAGSRYP